MDAKDAQQLAKAAIQEPADAERQEDDIFHHHQDDLFHGVKDGADGKQGDDDAEQQGQKGGDNQVDGVGDMLAEPLLKLGGQDTGGEGGQHRALIARHRQETEEGEGFGGAGTHVVGAGETGTHQHQAQDDADDRASAEVAEGGPADQGGQEGKGSVGQNLGEGQQLGGNVGGGHPKDIQDGFLGQQAPQAHKQTGGHQYRDDGNEHVREHPYRPLEGIAVDRLLLGLVGSGRDGVGVAHQLHHFIVDPVHQAGAQDDLVLARVEKRAFHVVQVLDGLGVDFLLVGDDQPQTGGAVADRDDVSFAAYLFDDRGGQFFVGHDGFLLYQIRCSGWGAG